MIYPFITPLTRPMLAFCLFMGLLPQLMMAQNFGDALRYSFYEPSGSARFIGAGSALGPLGADFSVLSTNPAGIGWMHKSEFVISPGFALGNTTARLSSGVDNLPFTDADAQLQVTNLGLVLASNNRRNAGTFNFGIGINRLADFNQQVYYKGDSPGSIVSRFEELANANGLDDFEAGVAFDAQALFLDNNEYLSDFTDNVEATVQREQTISREGGLTEFSMGFAGSSNDQVIWGLSIGIPILDYNEEKIYEETDAADNVPFFDRLAYSEQLTAAGAGVNLKLGVIYRVNQAVRLGAAVHTPTYYEISEDFTTDMVYEYTVDDTKQTGTALSPLGEYSYSLRTPWRFMGGAGLVVGRNGFVTGEVEYADYGGNRFIFNDFSGDEAFVNQGVTDNLKGALKVRLGAELATGGFRVRGGFGLQQAPLQGDDNFYNHYSFGAGWRGRSLYFDVGYRHIANVVAFTPYRTGSAPAQNVDMDISRENLVLTFGVKW